MQARPTPNSRLLLWRGATRACAVCGRRHLTGRRRQLRAVCPRCGFRFERSPGHFVGAVGINTTITSALLLLTLLTGIALSWPDLRVAPLMAATISVAVIVPILIHPTTKTLWVAIDLAVRPLEPGEAIGRPEEGPS